MLVRTEAPPSAPQRRRVPLERTWSLTTTMATMVTSVLMAVLGIAACDDGGTPQNCGLTGTLECARAVHADKVVEAPGDTGKGNGDANLAANDVRGGGDGQGSLDVFSLGYSAEDSYIVLGWSEAVVLNGPGDDLVVFENGFMLPGSDRAFMDLAIVEVSADGQDWVAFPHDYIAQDETAYSKLPSDWIGFAGRTPVRFNVDLNPDADPFDHVASGGDAFDFDSLPDAPATNAILTAGCRFVRITAASARINPDTGEAYPHELVSNGPDIDGVYGRYVVAR